MAEGGLGRIAAPDSRDQGFLMRAMRPSVFEQPISALPKTKHYARGLLLDQGMTGTCVEHSLEAKLRGAPHRVGPSRIPKRYEVYDEAIQIDEFPSNDRDVARVFGTSVRAGCKVLHRRGFISAYHWTYTTDEVLRWILGGQGGLVLGIDWYSEMNRPTAEGIIRAKGRYEGGHAIYAFGADRVLGTVSLQNSWGHTYGGYPLRPGGPKVNLGCVKLPLEDLDNLLKNAGEAVAITEVPYTRNRVTEGP